MTQLFTLLVSIFLALGAGVSFVFQQAVNAGLRTDLNSAAWAGFVSYLGGSICMLILAAALRDPIPFTASALRTNWWAWSGGLFGAIYIAISIVLVPQLGTAAFIALLVSGQMLASLIFDHFGLFGVAQHSMGLGRIAGGLLLIGGVVLLQL